MSRYCMKCGRAIPDGYGWRWCRPREDCYAYLEKRKELERQRDAQRMLKYLLKMKWGKCVECERWFEKSGDGMSHWQLHKMVCSKKCKDRRSRRNVNKQRAFGELVKVATMLEQAT